MQEQIQEMRQRVSLVREIMCSVYCDYNNMLSWLQEEQLLLSSGTEKLNRKEAESTMALQSIRKYQQQIKHKVSSHNDD